MWIMKFYTLNNKVKIPALGFGVWHLKGNVCRQSVNTAIKSGYRLFDTAAMYGNEQEVGEAIRESGVNREDFFITSKLWVTDMGYNRTKKAFEASLKRLGMDYLDLYLIHWPGFGVSGSWKAMEELHESGKIKAIGVSNFSERQIENLTKSAKVVPTVNQVKFNPQIPQTKLKKYLEEKKIILEAYYPVGGQGAGLLSSPVLNKIAEAHKKTPAQIVLRWHIQQNVIAIPRSENPEHIKSNFDIWDFELSEKEMEEIRRMGN